MSIGKDARPTRALPLKPQLPKLKPATVADVDPDDGPLVAPPTLLTTAASYHHACVRLPCCSPNVTTTGSPSRVGTLYVLPPSPALSLHSTALFDFQLDASHAVPPVMSIGKDARPTRALPL